ncbi:MAG: hypothetical protein QM754_05800 [Tepidisphaeraceae bacterium]
MNRRRTGVWLAFFIGLAIVARVGVIAYTHALHAPPEENRLIARNLQGGRGFTFTEFTVTGPTAIRGPAYPFLLALIGPDRLWLSLTLNTLAGAATVLAAYTLTRRLLAPSPLEGEGWGEGSAATHERQRGTVAENPSPNPLPQGEEAHARRSALIAAFCFAVWPTQIYAASLTQGLAIAVLLTLSSLALAWRKTPAASIAAGVLAGLAALTEPVLALPLLLSAIVLGWRKNWPNAVVFVAVGCVTVAPWLYRNAIVFGGPMPITSNFWRDAFLGNGPQASGSRLASYQIGLNGEALSARTRIDLLPAPEYDALKVSESKRITVFRNAAFGWVRHHPNEYAWLCAARIYSILEPSHPLAQFRFFGIPNLRIERIASTLGYSQMAAVCWPRVGIGAGTDHSLDFHFVRSTRSGVTGRSLDSRCRSCLWLSHPALAQRLCRGDACVARTPARRPRARQASPLQQKSRGRRPRFRSSARVPIQQNGPPARGRRRRF